jgi:hypothetical protein
MNRRHALQACTVIAVTALGETTARAEPKIERVIARVGRNHGHELVVSPADVRAGVPRTYDLTGTSGHAHEVTLTADHFKELQAGGVLRMPSTRYQSAQGAGHLHRLLVKMGPLVDPPESINACDVAIGGKDDHELVVSASDLAAGAEKTFDIQGIAPHGHRVTITAGDFEKLRAGTQIRLRSTEGDDHTHLVFVSHLLKKP